MLLKGKHILPAGPEKVWPLIMDTDTLARIIPGVSRLEKISENNFKSILDIKMGPVNGSFTGNLQLNDVVEQKGFTLKVQQNSRIGNANADIKVGMAPAGENQTEVSFDGDVKLSGLLAGIGQRLLGGVSNTLTKQFFENLEKELAV